MTLVNEILYGDVASVQQVLDLGADDIHEIDPYGYTPLIETAIVNNKEMAALLLNKGVDVNQKDLVGRTALHWAVDNNNLPFCKLLLKHQANTNAYSESGHPILVNPLLRQQHHLKKLLYQHGADLNFAQDYINTKLIGHRYELLGVVDIVNNHGEFIELDFEGFYLEFTLAIILDSLNRYRNNFAARHLRPYFKDLQKVIGALNTAAELVRYQHYLVNLEEYTKRIQELLDYELLLMPMAHHGHALTFIRYKNLLVKCDRGANSEAEGTVVVYQMNFPEKLTKAFIMDLIYKKQTQDYVYRDINKILGLQKIAELPLRKQVTGNCSWANVEASIPAMLFLLLLDSSKDEIKIADTKETAMHIYHEWLEWDKDCSLSDCIQSFVQASPARKASKAAIMGAILFQRCNYKHDKDLERAGKILRVLTVPQYKYVLQSYINVYGKDKNSRAGRNLIEILELFGIRID